MKYLNFPIEDLKSSGGFHTAKEISSQPEMWEKTYLKLIKEKKHIAQFLEKILKREFLNVVLTGAGSSAFVGEALAGKFQKEWRVSCRAIATTDIVTHPENCFIKSSPTLLISFARSGDSPESVAAVKLAKEYCDTLFELNITCNENGELARNTGEENSCVFLLPEETNDRSLAMTSSFSSMLLAGLLIANLEDIDKMRPVVLELQSLGKHIVDWCLPTLKNIADLEFERIVFLGSGPLLGVAHESHLKVQELSDGKIVGKYDSFLGFRHGPKAIVNNSTIIVYLFSNNSGKNRYEFDLVKSVNETGAGQKSVAIGHGYDINEFKFDFSIHLPKQVLDIPDDFLPVFYILPAQIIAFYKSLGLGLAPDSPSKQSSISRVVQGVKIYSTIEI